MTEEFLQYVWKYQLFDKENLITSRGENIEIIFPGMQNNDSGPDFTGSKIKIDGILWVGNIEVHLNSSDWYSHGHDRDKAYDNVILHVVLNDDIPIKNSLGNEISSIKIEIKDFIVQNYKKLIADSHPIACHELIPAIDRIHFVSWLSKLTVERLMNRAIDIDNILKETNNSIENAFYIYIAKSFGFKVNSQPFEMLARSLPLNLLSHYKNNLFQIEALIIGQSGYLEDNVSEKYFNDLKNEYSFLKKKHSLIPLKKHVWKTMRLRPSNFPLIRLAQFAALIHKSSHLFSKIIESESVNDVERLFEVTASEYWDSHYNF